MVERIGKTGAIWRVWPNEPVSSLPGLRTGLPLNRNRDHAWEQALTKRSAERRIRVNAVFAEIPEGFSLTLQDENGITATATVAFDKQPAQQHPAEAEAGLREQLSRLGNTDFELSAITINWTQHWFLPSSLVNRLRRDAIEKLEAARLGAYVRPQRRAAIEPPAVYPEQTLSYLANVYNHAARAFYAKHGAKQIAAAYEQHEETGEVSPMITRHCVRYSLSLCPKQAKGVVGVQGQVRAEPMTLVSGKERLTLKFDCNACEMHVMGKIKKRIQQSPPSLVAPIMFHPRRAGAVQSCAASSWEG